MPSILCPVPGCWKWCMGGGNSAERAVERHIIDKKDALHCEFRDRDPTRFPRKVPSTSPSDEPPGLVPPAAVPPRQPVTVYEYGNTLVPAIKPPITAERVEFDSWFHLWNEAVGAATSPHALPAGASAVSPQRRELVNLPWPDPAAIASFIQPSSSIPLQPENRLKKLLLLFRPDKFVPMAKKASKEGRMWPGHTASEAAREEMVLGTFKANLIFVQLNKIRKSM